MRLLTYGPRHPWSDLQPDFWKILCTMAANRRLTEQWGVPQRWLSAVHE